MATAVLASAPPLRGAVVAMPTLPSSFPARSADPESAAWVDALAATGPRHEEAVGRLRELLLRAARFELARRRHALAAGARSDIDDLAEQAASDALMAILRKLGDYRGESRFTTWAYKFALLEAGVKARRRAWQGHELPLEDDGWARLADRRASPDVDAETAELIDALQRGIADALTPRQRTVLIALALNDVPIDVLADRLSTTRGALYKTLHDARRKLRAQLAAEGHLPEVVGEGGTR